MGEVKLGSTYKELRRKDLVGPSRPGCPIKQGERIALLKPPLEGGVILTASAPRKVANISIRGRDDPRRRRGRNDSRDQGGVSQGKGQPPKRGSFSITSVDIPQGGGGKLLFAVDIKTKKTTVIGIPTLPPCE